MGDSRSGSSDHNVNETEFEAYLSTFFARLTDLAERFVPEYANQLFHTGQLPALITGFVSTQYGVGYEMQRASSTSIRIKRGSARIEDLVWADAPSSMRAVLPALVFSNSTHGLIKDSEFVNALPVRLKGVSDEITLVNVLCSSDWGYRRRVEFLRLSGRREAEFWTPERAATRAAEEVLSASAEIQLARRRSTTIEEFVAVHKEHSVLVLGSYDEPGRERLAKLSEAMRREGYEPFLASDVVDEPSLSLQQKVTLLAHLARFVVIDDTDPSGHVVEMKIAFDNNLHTIVLQGTGHPSSSMLAEMPILKSNFKAFPYDPYDPGDVVVAAVRWVESTMTDVTGAYNSLYPWRSGFLAPGEANSPS